MLILDGLSPSQLKHVQEAFDSGKLSANRATWVDIRTVIDNADFDVEHKRKFGMLFNEITPYSHGLRCADCGHPWLHHNGHMCPRSRV